MKRISPAPAALLVALALSGCSRVADRADIDPMTGKPWVKVVMFSPDRSLRLSIQCSENKTDVAIESNSTLTSEEGLSVMFKFPGDANPTDEVWSAMTDHKGAVRERDDSEFIKKLIAAKQVRVRLTPIGSEVADADFDSSGLAERLGKYADRCGWGDLIKEAGGTAS